MQLDFSTVLGGNGLQSLNLNFPKGAKENKQGSPGPGFERESTLTWEREGILRMVGFSPTQLLPSRPLQSTLPLINVMKSQSGLC